MPDRAAKALNPQDHNLHFLFWMDFQQRLEEDAFAEKLILVTRRHFMFVIR
jgi:hypothetical protein